MRRSGAVTKQLIYQAALEAFTEKTYAGASLRDIARRVGIEVASLYNHIGSKEELLYDLILESTEELIRVLDEAIDAADPADVRQQLINAIAANVEFAANNTRYNVTVGKAELESLNAEHHQIVSQLRGAVEEKFKNLVNACVTEGYLPQHTSVTVLAFFLIAIGTSVSRWYDERGPLQPDAIANIATELIVNGLQPRSPARHDTA